MVCEVRLEQEGSHAVVVHRAVDGAVDRLRAVADRLAAASHPGVVQVLASTGDDASWELRTAHGGRPLDVAWPLPLDALAGIMASVAATLADLHEVGVVHGRLRAQHVLLGRHGRPVLCGFGPGPDHDGGGPAPTPADDVAAVGEILVQLLGDDADEEPVPERRWQRRSGWSGWTRRSLLTLADQACAEPPTRRPSARRLAAGIAEAVPAAGTGQEAPKPDRSGPLPRRPLALRAGALALVVGALLVVLSATRGTRAPTDAAPITSQPTTVQPTTTTTTTTTTTAAAAVARPADIVVDGTLVTAGDRRFEVGRPGDVVAVGDWDCDGHPSPAVLRPASGQVFVFPRWADQDPVTVHPITAVPGGVQLVTQDLGSGCHSLAVRSATGAVVDITRRASA